MVDPWDVKEIVREMVGPQDWIDEMPDPDVRCVRLKISQSGHLTLAHPKADGPHITKVQQVPSAVSAADILRRMQSVTVLRPDRTVHYDRIHSGAIVR